MFDDFEGLEPRAVADARQEEIAFMERIGLWEAATLEECWRKTGKGPIGAR